MMDSESILITDSEFGIKMYIYWTIFQIEGNQLDSKSFF